MLIVGHHDGSTREATGSSEPVEHRHQGPRGTWILQTLEFSFIPLPAPSRASRPMFIWRAHSTHILNIHRSTFLTGTQQENRQPPSPNQPLNFKQHRKSHIHSLFFSVHRTFLHSSQYPLQPSLCTGVIPCQDEDQLGSGLHVPTSFGRPTYLARGPLAVFGVVTSTHNPAAGQYQRLFDKVSDIIVGAGTVFPLPAIWPPSVTLRTSQWMRGCRLGCYGTTLNCSDKSIPLYQQCGFKKNENEMAQYHHVAASAAATTTIVVNRPVHTLGWG
ncbi:hypothetical protein D9619_012288 [Psilocybe cf. subviscida]|uniref:Uncharacterized protein n=1 Tax=Psilocybe cf. subviscida TaxID=2480587 RepID=A0A8H5ARE1_9AGAR|nr:hypothetical protein D9619_012288 [Psilocybe cf. subviscida]